MTRRTLFLTLCAVPLYAQQPPTFQAQSPLVMVPVTVSDKQGHPVYGLVATDFQLLDDGQPRPFHVDPPGEYRSGVSAVIVIQTSGVSGSALAKIKKTGSMVSGYITGQGGEAAVITADHEPHLVQSFTSDPDAVENAFRALAASDQRAGCDLDAISQALALLATGDHDRRRIVVLISETRDRGSKVSLPAILRRAQQENVTIWTVSYSVYVTPFTTRASDWEQQGGDKSPDSLAALTEPMRFAKPNISDDLARYTGGRHLSFARLKSLEEDLASVGKEIHTQYLLSFVPSSKPPDLHRIEIQVKGHPEASLRYRPVY